MDNWIGLHCCNGIIDIDDKRITRAKVVSDVQLHNAEPKNTPKKICGTKPLNKGQENVKQYNILCLDIYICCKYV